MRLGTPTGFAAAQTLAAPDSGYERALVAADLDGDDLDASATVVLIRSRADGTS